VTRHGVSECSYAYWQVRTDRYLGVFGLAHLCPVVFDFTIWDSLEVEDERKRFVRDLVFDHKTSGNTFDDFVQSKGKGLVGLLSGPPGIGKTMTAEAIAEIAERPFYVISSGELGDNSETIHERLKEILELAELWHAVVLLDEADVFLSTREDNDLARNAITSIFLRELEYFKGILILTTNRQKTIDSAFESRIHFSCEYPNLSDQSREAIWRKFLKRVAEGGRTEVIANDDDYGRLAAFNLNGRQIKNVTSVAQSIAAQRGEAVTMTAIEKTIELCGNFAISRAESL
jgi:SpoVK/Ycf46/Vps4 family AAA+-type ATPase